MSHPLLHRLRVLLGALIPALACWLLLPGTTVDRISLTAAARCFANPPLFVSGKGSHADPWKLRSLASTIRSDERQAPIVISLGDDLDGFFQTNPPSAIDIAVVLKNFQRLGTRKAATAAVLAWDSPDPIGLLALEKVIGAFDSITMAAPLSRGAVPESIPPAFRRASVPLATIRGNANNLPVVNRIPLEGIILGRENTLAGFQSLDSEPPTEFPPLLARWENRVVFAFPVLTAIQRLDLPVSGVEIHLGQYLKLGPDGPIVPLDEFGRLPLNLHHHRPLAEIPAEKLIDGDKNLFPAEPPQPVILRDDRTAAEPATRAFSENLSALVTALSSDTGLSRARILHRLGPAYEFLLLGLLALALTLIARLRPFPRKIALLVTTFLVVTLQLTASYHSLWLPGLAALAAIGFTYLVSGLAPPKQSRSVSPELPAQPEPESQTKPTEPSPDEAADSPSTAKQPTTPNRQPATHQKNKHPQKKRQRANAGGADRNLTSFRVKSDR